MDKLERYSLNELVDVRDGTHDSPKYVNDGFPLITSKNLVNGSVDFENVNFITETDFDSINKRSKVDEGDILYSMIGSIGNFAIVNFEPRFAIKNVALFKFKNSKLSSKYFIYYIKSNEFTTQIEKQSKGGTQKFVTLKILRNIQVPLPPLPQQQKIADILDAADALRQNDKAIIAKYDKLTQALFLDMFGDPVSNPKGWEKVELKKLMKNVSKIGRDYNSTNIEYVDISSIDNSKFMIVTTTNFLLGDRPSRAQQIIENGDVLLSTVRPNLKNIAINNISGLIASTGFYVFRCNNKINNKYLFEVLKSDSVTNYFVGITAGANYPAVKSSDVSKFLISSPPIDLQNQFAERVAVIEEQKAIAQKSLEKSESLFNSLLQKAFKGELI